jgi:hypothetical protein
MSPPVVLVSEPITIPSTQIMAITVVIGFLLWYALRIVYHRLASKYYPSYNTIVTISDWIVLGVGIYAGVTATATLVWNILRERHNIVVRVKYAYGVGFIGGEEMIAIEVVNNGRRPINIQEVGFIASDGRKLINPKRQHNLGWLKDRDGVSVYIPRQEIQDMVKEAREHNISVKAAYVRDSTSRYYKGKISKQANWFNK